MQHVRREVIAVFVILAATTAWAIIHDRHISKQLSRSEDRVTELENEVIELKTNESALRFKTARLVGAIHSLDGATQEAEIAVTDIDCRHLQSGVDDVELALEDVAKHTSTIKSIVREIEQASNDSGT